MYYNVHPGSLCTESIDSSYSYEAQNLRTVSVHTDTAVTNTYKPRLHPHSVRGTVYTSPCTSCFNHINFVLMVTVF